MEFHIGGELLAFHPILVHADLDEFPALELALVLVGLAGDLGLYQPLAHGVDDATPLLVHTPHLGDDSLLHLRGQPLDVVRAGQRVHRVGQAHLLGQNLHGA